MPSKKVCINLKDDHDLIEQFSTEITLKFFAPDMICPICLLAIASFSFVAMQRRI